MPYTSWNNTLVRQGRFKYPTYQRFLDMLESLETTDFSLQASRTAALATLNRTTVDDAQRLESYVSINKRFPDSVMLVNIYDSEIIGKLGQIRSALMIRMKDKDERVRDNAPAPSQGQYNDTQLAYSKAIEEIITTMYSGRHVIEQGTFESDNSLSWATAAP